MDLLLEISQNIITIWWAIIIMLLALILIICIKILLKLNSIINDINEKYNTFLYNILKPISKIIYFYNKVNKKWTKSKKC